MPPLSTASALLALAVALSVSGFVVLVRSVPWVVRQMFKAKKPWSCDICLCFWLTSILLVFLAYLSGSFRVVWLFGPAYPLSLWFLSRLEDPRGPPPTPMPKLIDDSE